jgi:hypothetical protein
MASKAQENSTGEKASSMARGVVKRRELGMGASTRLPQVGTRQFLDEIFGMVHGVRVESAKVKI